MQVFKKIVFLICPDLSVPLQQVWIDGLINDIFPLNLSVNKNSPEYETGSIRKLHHGQKKKLSPQRDYFQYNKFL